MEIDRAKDIIQALADGVDPYTGDRFPADGPYQRADTVRALFMAIEAMGKTRRARDPRPVDPNKPKAGAAWSPEEEQRLRDAFNARKPIAEIASDHGRTPGAINARLVKLGLIEDNPTNRAGQGNRPAPPAPPSSRPSTSLDGSPSIQPELTEDERDNLPF